MYQEGGRTHLMKFPGFLSLLTSFQGRMRWEKVKEKSGELDRKKTLNMLRIFLRKEFRLEECH